MDRNENFVLVYGIVIVLALVVVLGFWVERALLRTLAQRATERAFHLGGRSPGLCGNALPWEEVGFHSLHPGRG